MQAIYTCLISFNPSNSPKRQQLQLLPFNRSRSRSSAQGQGSPRSRNEGGRLSARFLWAPAVRPPALGHGAASLTTTKHHSNPRPLLGTHWALVLPKERLSPNTPLLSTPQIMSSAKNVHAPEKAGIAIHLEPATGQTSTP